MVGRRPSSLPKLGEKAQQLGSTGVNNSFSPDVFIVSCSCCFFWLNGVNTLYLVQGILMRDRKGYFGPHCGVDRKMQP